MRQTVRKALLADAFLVFQIRLLHLFFSPFLPIAAASKAIASATIITYSILFLSSLFLGRAFCGWFCPGAAINELLGLVITKPTKGSWRNGIKYWISGMWTVSLVAAIASANGLAHLDLFYGTAAGDDPPQFIIRFGVYILILPLAVLFGRCRATISAGLRRCWSSGQEFNNSLGGLLFSWESITRPAYLANRAGTHAR